jgi:hypothetical protein
MDIDLFKFYEVKEIVKNHQKLLKNKIEVAYDFRCWNTNGDTLIIRSQRRKIGTLDPMNISDIQ